MCGDAPSPPSGGLPDGGVPGGTPTGPAGGTGLCCACPANGDMSSNGIGTYCTTDYPHWPTLNNKGKIAIQRTEEGGSVTVTKTFSLSYTAGATEAAHKGTITSAITTAMSTWTSSAANFRIQIEQPGCKIQKLTMVYASSIVPSGANVAVSVDGTPAPTSGEGLRSKVVDGTEMIFYTNGVGDIPWTMVHEIGHTFGLPDEYTFDRPSATKPKVTFKGASLPDKVVELENSPIVNADAAKHNFDSDDVMGRNGNNKYPEYLFYWIAIEVDKVLKAAGVTAVVKVVAA